MLGAVVLDLVEDGLGALRVSDTQDEPIGLVLHEQLLHGLESLAVENGVSAIGSYSVRLAIAYAQNFNSSRGITSSS